MIHYSINNEVDSNLYKTRHISENHETINEFDYINISIKEKSSGVNKFKQKLLARNQSQR